MKEFCISHKSEVDVAVCVKAKDQEEAMKKFYNGEGYNQEIELGDAYDVEIVDEFEIEVELIKGHVYVGKGKNETMKIEYEGVFFCDGTFLITIDGYYFSKEEVTLLSDITSKDLIEGIKKSTEITPVGE